MKKTNSFQGFEPWYHGIKMSLKMHGWILIVLLLIQGVFFSYLFYTKYDYSDYYNVKNCFNLFFAESLGWLFSNVKLLMYYSETNKLYEILSSELSTRGEWVVVTQEQFALTFNKVTAVFLSSLWVYLAYPFFLLFFQRKSRKQTEELYLRGAKLDTIKEYNKASKNKEKGMSFGAISMPLENEVLHTLVIGSPGTGKTNLFLQLIEQLLQRNHPLIVHDFKGDYVSYFFKEGRDELFNPFDVRGVRWNLFNEIQTPMDIDSIAVSLLPTPPSGDPYWVNAAREVFAGILLYLLKTKQGNNEQIYRMITSGCETIKVCLEQTPGAEAGLAHIMHPGQKQSDSVLSVMMEKLAFFKYLKNSDGDFSISNWFQQQGGRILFLSNQTIYQDSLKPILTLFFDLMGRKLLSLGESKDRRVFLFLDELGQLNKVSMIERLLTQSRSKGGSVFVGIQDLGQLDRIYGAAGRKTIVNSCGNSAIFALEDPQEREFFSLKLGEQEVSRSETNVSMGVQDFKDGLSMQRRTIQQRIVLPSQLESLNVGETYVSFREFNPVLVPLKPSLFEASTASFLPQEGCKDLYSNEEQKKPHNASLGNKGENKEVSTLVAQETTVEAVVPMEKDLNPQGQDQDQEIINRLTNSLEL